MADSEILRRLSATRRNRDLSQPREHEVPRGDLDFYIQLARNVVGREQPLLEETSKNKLRFSKSTRSIKPITGEVAAAISFADEPAVVSNTKKGFNSDEEFHSNLEKIRFHSTKEFPRCWTSGNLFYGTTSSSTRTIQLMQEEPIRFRSLEFDRVDMLEKYRHFEWYDSIREESKKATKESQTEKK